MKNLPANHALLRVVAFLGTAEASSLCGDASKHVKHAAIHPKMNKPFDVSRLAIKQEMRIFNITTQKQFWAPELQTGQKRSFERPEKNFKKNGPVLGRRTKW